MSSFPYTAMADATGSLGICIAVLVRDALRSYRLREALRQSQTQLTPLARASGWLNENDIFQDES